LARPAVTARNGVAGDDYDGVQPAPGGSLHDSEHNGTDGERAPKAARASAARTRTSAISPL
ncbi:hypothetical protein ACLFKT_29245, partial [Paraburkholderia sp. BR14261]